MTRQADNWLKTYGEYTKESESPDIYHLWTGLSVLASAVRRNLYLDQGIYQVIPNLYVILIGPRGKVKKSTTIRMGRKILLAADDILFGPDSLTRAELIAELARAGEGRTQSALTIHSSEFSSLVDPSGIPMIQFLTDIFDGDFSWRYATKGSGKYEINKPSLNILAGTTPTWLAEDFPAQVIGHGFISRVVFVYAGQERFANPRPARPDPEIVRVLQEDLRHIASLEGEFKWGERSTELYDKLYHNIKNNPPKDAKVEGFHYRKDLMLLKVSMLLSVAESDSLVIEPKHISTAWKLLNGVEKEMPKAFQAVGRYEKSAELSRILEHIQTTGKVSIAEIYRTHMTSASGREIVEMLEMLIQSGEIVKDVDSRNKVFFRPTDDAIPAMQRVDPKDDQPQKTDA